MRIGVASGKGGTGKTLVSTNLARIMGETGSVRYLDCDVEEPNGHLFLHPEIDRSADVCVDIPAIDGQLCSHCGECGRFCRFGALAAMPDKTILFPELCHSCGGCAEVCPVGAITWTQRSIGVVETGTSGRVEFAHGRIRVGEPMSPPLIKAVLACSPDDGVTLVDSPPGTACPVIAAVRGCDLVMLVVEPTPFGVHDFGLALDLTRALGVRTVAVVNRDGIGDDHIDRLCAEAGVPILARIPYDRGIAEVYARGELVVDSLTHIRPTFERLAESMQSEASCARS